MRRGAGSRWCAIGGARRANSQPPIGCDRRHGPLSSLCSGPAGYMARIEQHMGQATPRHIRLTSHPGSAGLRAIPLRWGAADPQQRGPVVASPAEPSHRNAIGAYSGAYGIYRALAVATGALARDHRPDLTDTAPAAAITPNPYWADPDRIVALDPWGHLVGEIFADAICAGIDVRPTIAVTTAHIVMPEIRDRIAEHALVPDGKVLLESGEIRVTKAAIDRDWPRGLASAKPNCGAPCSKKQAVCIPNSSPGPISKCCSRRPAGRRFIFSARWPICLGRAP